MRRAYSYLRFSTPEQAKGDSFRRQSEAAIKYAKANDLQLDDQLTFEDLGVSAYHGTNSATGQLSAFLEAVRDGVVQRGSFLLVESLDRLSRQSARKAMNVLNGIIDQGITVVTLNDGRTYHEEALDNDPLAIMIALLTFIRANEESETKARRLRSSWENKRKGAADKPLTSLVPAWIRLVNGRLELDDERAPVVRRIVEMTFAGKGQHTIAETLNREGIPTFGRGSVKSVMWHRSYVSKIIKSSTLVGTLTPHQTGRENGKKTRVPLQAIPGYYPAVVTEEEWSDLVALTKAVRRVPQQRQSGIKNVLAGLAVCPACGSTMTRVMKGDVKKAGRPKLVCTKAKAGAGCAYRAVDLDAVERAVREKISVVISEAPAGSSDLDARLEAARATLYGLEEAISNIIATISEDGASPALRQALSSLEAEKVKAEGEVYRLDAEHTVASGPTIVRRWAELGRAAESSAEELNTKLRTVFERVVVDYHTGDLDFVWKGGLVHPSGLQFAWPDQDGV